MSVIPSDVDEARLNEICGQRWAESLTLDFKRELPAPGTEADKRELLKDVCAMANADGGDLVYGLDEANGAADKLSPIAGESADAAKRRLGQVIDAGIEPRIPGLRSLSTRESPLTSRPPTTSSTSCMPLRSAPAGGLWPSTSITLCPAPRDVQDLEERNPRTGRPKQKWHPLTRVDEGQAALVKALDELLGRAPVQQGNMKAHIEEFKAVRYPDVGPETRDEYNRMFEVINKAFKPFDSADVESGDVITFLQDNFAAKLNTRSKYKGLLSSFFSWCCLSLHTGVKINPCREIKMSRPPKRRGKLNAERFWKIHDALTPMGRCFLELMYFTRQRPTEIRLLRDSHIGPEAYPEYIHFVPTKTEAKTAEEVHVRITPEIRAVVERARALRPKPKVVRIERRRDPFIIQTRSGDGYSKNGLYEVWRDAVDAAGYTGRNITTRDVRPYALNMMEKMGYGVREIQKSAAHTSVTTTEGYLDQHRERLSDAWIPLPERQR